MDTKDDSIMLPKEFYYSQDSSKVRYSNKPSGQIDIHRIIKGQADCFVSGTGSRTESPKKMIFADWTAGHWDAEKIDQVQRQLSALIDEGFSIYLWQSGRVVPLNKEDLSCLKDPEIRKKISPEQPEIIINAGIREQKLTRDSTFILDDYWLERINQPDKVDLPRILKASDFANLGKSERKKLPGIVEKSNPKVSSAVFDTLSKKTMAIASRFKESFMHLPLEENIETLELDFDFADSGKEFSQFGNLKKIFITKDGMISENDLMELFNQAPGLEAFTYIEDRRNPNISLSSIHKKNLLMLKKVKINATGVSSSGLESVLRSQTLEEIHLNDCEDATEGIFEFLSTEERKQTALTHLTLISCTIRNSDLVALMNGTSLEHLIFIDADISGDVPDTESINLDNLKSLHVTRKLPAEYLLLLTSAPHLEELRLLNQPVSELKKILHDNSTGRFKTLKKISITNFFDPECLRLLAAKSPLLEEIRLRHCKNIQGDFSVLSQSNFGNLKKMDLSSSEILADALASLLQASQHLQEIELMHCSFLSGEWSALSALFLPSLRKIDFTESNINGDVFIVLLQAFPNVEEINLNSCKKFSALSSALSGLSLKKLKKISLINSTVPATVLSNLLYASPGLEAIDLRGCTGLPELPVLSDLSLPALRKINLDYPFSIIHANALCALLKASPHLEELLLGTGEILSDDLYEFSNLSLYNLKKIDLQNSSIDANTLTMLLKSAPNLEEINLLSCGNIKDLSLSSNLTFPRLKKIDLSNSVFQADTLIALAKACPALEEIKIDPSVIDVSDPKKRTLLEAFRQILTIPALEEKSRQQLITLCETLEKDLAPKAPKVFDYNDIRNMLTDNSLPFDDSSLTGADYGSRSNIEFLLTKDEWEKLKNISNTKNRNAEKLNEQSLDADAAPPSIIRILDYLTENALTESTHISQSKSKNPVKLNKTPDYLDANTEHKKIKYALDSFFYALDYTEAPPPMYYRLAVFNTFKASENPCKLNQAFEIGSEPDPQLKTCLIERMQEDVFQAGQGLILEQTVFYGKRLFNLTDEWQAIPSLKAGETLLKFHTDPPEAAVDIQYSERDSLYYVRSTAGKQNIGLDFLVQMPDKPCALPEDIQAMVNDMNNWGSGALEKQSDNPGGKDYLTWMRTQKKGACRHRAFVFSEWMKTTHPDIPVRMILNDCHAFAEVNLHGTWVSCQLGGYAADLEIHETYSPHLAPDETAPITEEPLIYQPLPDPAYSKYDKLMQPWKKTDKNRISLKSYQQKLLQENRGKNCLIELDSNKAVSAMLLSLQTLCQKTQRPVFYIHSPEDVLCSAPFLKQQPDNTGILCGGPGGPLHDFLVQPFPADNPPVLIVNYANFNADDIVRLNTLLDANRSADSTPIPEQAAVIGIINIEKPDCYQGSDFYSRFHQSEHNPVTDVELEAILPSVSDKSEDTQDTWPINLYNSPDWKSRLTGSWVLSEGKLVFQEGLLLQALKANKPIEIRNGPWDDPEFGFFWQQLSATGLELHGEKHVLDATRLCRSEHYDWQTLTKNLENLSEAPEMLLNPGNFIDYFHRYTCLNEHKTLVALPGHIQQASDNQQNLLRVHLTRSLSEDDWALLLGTCQKQGLTLQVYSAPGVKIPPVLQEILQPAKRQTLPWDANEDSPAQVILSSDPDTSIAMLLQKDADTLVIDVSECKPADLLTRTQPEFIKDLLVFEFTETESALLTALAAGKSVILKGHISEELADALATVLLSRKQEKVRGKLIVISHEKDRLNYFPESRVHNVTREEKQGCCNALGEDINWDEPLSTIKARLQDPEGWEGLSTLKTAIPPLEALDIASSKEKTLAFNASRQACIEKVLGRSPYVFIAGLSGVGKSTFVEKELFKDRPHTLHIGENALTSWAKDRSTELKLLFIDEANLSARQWTEFEGLFNTPPTILIDGTLHTLTSEHKVIFAGNPVSYGDERTLSPFFTRHGQAVVFEPLPLAIIYEQILKPVFANSQYEEASANIAKPFLEVYNFLCQLSTTEILISPRELQMMALLTRSWCEKMPDVEAEKVAAHYAFAVAKHLLPANYQSLFKNKFEISTPLPPLPLPEMPGKSSFKITESRKKTANILHEILLLRASRAHGSNDEQKYGGLGGMILEGEPGVGKSELVMAILRAQGFEERKPNQESEVSGQEKVFYHVKLSMSKTEREKLLLKAFDEGAVVVIDEINSSTMMERLLNDLLMGKNPYNSDPRPKNPGFMVIGTQNPVTMAGRRAASTALSRRLYSEELPPYPRNEILEIIQGEEPLPPKIEKELEDLVDSYLKNAELAKKYYYSPAPTFRDLLRTARQITSRMNPSAALAPVVEKPVVEKVSFSDSQTLWQKTPPPAPKVEPESEIRPETK